MLSAAAVITDPFAFGRPAPMTDIGTATVPVIDPSRENRGIRPPAFHGPRDWRGVCGSRVEDIVSE